MHIFAAEFRNKFYDKEKPDPVHKPVNESKDTGTTVNEGLIEKSEELKQTGSTDNPSEHSLRFTQKD